MGPHLAAIDAVLRDPAYRERTSSLAKEIAACPGKSGVVERAATREP